MLGLDYHVLLPRLYSSVLDGRELCLYEVEASYIIDLN